MAEEMAELQRERSGVRRESELKQEELYREVYLIVSESSGWRLVAESTLELLNF